MFDRILIANRGEIAVRIIRACRDCGISPIAVYSDADRAALHVALADRACRIGPAPAAESYLRVDRIIAAARRAGADALHPGYGFLAENAELARACSEAGIVFIGPSAEAIEQMGSKVASRELVATAGVAIVPGGPDAVSSPQQLLEQARQLGFPVLLKASAGGGGKGMRVVEREAGLERALAAAASEAEAAFGDPAVYVEKFIRRPRHIEVQLLGDSHGNLVHLGERECSIQRRHQKVVEECPSPLVDEDFRKRIGEAAVAIGKAVGYTGAGTVEFLVDSESGRGSFYFLEMNTRLQVEHPVTEMVTGVDLVVEQIRIAAGEPLDFGQDDVVLNGTAIECRVYAEDPQRGFLPSPGTITTLIEPSGPGIRNDSGAFAGCVIPVEYDPLVSKLVAHGRSRREAIRRMQRAVREYRISGVRTTLPFFSRLLRQPEFIAGDLHTGFIEEHGLAEAGGGAPETLPVAVAAAALAWRREQRLRHQRPREAPRSRWRSLDWRDPR